MHWISIGFLAILEITLKNNQNFSELFSFFSGWEPLDGLSWSEYGTEEHPQRGRYLHNRVGLDIRQYNLLCYTTKSLFSNNHKHYF